MSVGRPGAPPAPEARASGPSKGHLAGLWPPHWAPSETSGWTPSTPGPTHIYAHWRVLRRSPNPSQRHLFK